MNDNEDYNIRSIRVAIEDMNRNIELLNKNLCRIADILENNTSYGGDDGAFVIRLKTKLKENGGD